MGLGNLIRPWMRATIGDYLWYFFNSGQPTGNFKKIVKAESREEARTHIPAAETPDGDRVVTWGDAHHIIGGWWGLHWFTCEPLSSKPIEPILDATGRPIEQGDELWPINDFDRAKPTTVVGFRGYFAEFNRQMGDFQGYSGNSASHYVLREEYVHRAIRYHQCHLRSLQEEIE